MSTSPSLIVKNSAMTMETASNMESGPAPLLLLPVVNKTDIQIPNEVQIASTQTEDIVSKPSEQQEPDHTSKKRKSDDISDARVVVNMFGLEIPVLKLGESGRRNLKAAISRVSKDNMQLKEEIAKVSTVREATLIQLLCMAKMTGIWSYAVSLANDFANGKSSPSVKSNGGSRNGAQLSVNAGLPAATTDLRLGELGRSKLKAVLSDMARADPLLKQQMKAISSLKMASISQLIQMAKLAGVMSVAEDIAREFSQSCIDKRRKTLFGMGKVAALNNITKPILLDASTPRSSALPKPEESAPNAVPRRAALYSELDVARIAQAMATGPVMPQVAPTMPIPFQQQHSCEHQSYHQCPQHIYQLPAQQYQMAQIAAAQLNRAPRMSAQTAASIASRLLAPAGSHPSCSFPCNSYLPTRRSSAPADLIMGSMILEPISSSSSNEGESVVYVEADVPPMATKNI